MTTREYPTTVDGALRALDRLVGRWTVSGEATGEVRFEWLEGGHFLLQHVDLVQSGFRTQGLEVIGRERPFGAPEPGPDICSRYFDDHGNTIVGAGTKLVAFAADGSAWDGLEVGTPVLACSFGGFDGRTLYLVGATAIHTVRLTVTGQP